MAIRGQHAVKVLKNNIGSILILLLFWALVFAVCKPVETSKFDYFSENNMDGRFGVTSVIAEGVQISQAFTGAEDWLMSIEIFDAGYARMNDCAIGAEILNEQGEAILNEVIDASQWQDNSYYKLRFTPQPHSKGKTYTLILKGIDGTTENSPAIWLSDMVEDGNNAVVNGEEQNGVLAMQMTYERPMIKVVYIICWLAFMIISLRLLVQDNPAEGNLR